MSLADYAKRHENDGKRIDAENTINARSLLGEIFTVEDIVRIDKTKYGNPAYLIKIQDGSAFFTTKSMTKDLDKMMSEDVDISEIPGTKWTVVETHIDEHTDKAGKLWPACDFLLMQYIE